LIDYLYEIKTSRRNRTLDSKRFSTEEVENIFSPLKQVKSTQLSKKNIAKPVEMESVHIDINDAICKKGVFKIFKKIKK
jgi:hypothetical protein